MAEDEDAPSRRERQRGDNVPMPDPSTLTTEQLRRELTSLRSVLEARLDGMDRAMVLFSDNLTRVPTDTDKQVGHLKELHDEKFSSIQKQFEERDTRTEQAAIATKIAVDAALQAQKEAAGAQNESNAAAITKSELATTKQIDGIVALLGSSNKATDEKIGDLKSRFDRGDGSNSALYAVGSAVLAIIAILVALFAALHTGGAVQPTIQYVPAPLTAPATPR